MLLKLTTVAAVMLFYSFCPHLGNNPTKQNTSATEKTMQTPQTQVARAIKYQNGVATTLNLKQEFAEPIASLALQLVSSAEPLRLHLDQEAMTALRQNLNGYELFFSPPIGAMPDESGVSKLLFLQSGQFANDPTIPDARLFVALADGQYVQSPYVAEGKASLFTDMVELITNAAE